MKAYVINLDSRPDRWEHCLEQARIGGFALTRISAVDGRAPDYVAAFVKRPPGDISGRSLSPTETACFESHRKVWQAIVDSGDRHGIVLEDDMLFSSGFADCLQDSWVPDSVDIVKLETWGWHVYVDSAVLGKVGKIKLHRLRSTHIGGGGYILCARSALKLLKVTEGFTNPLDHVFFDTRSPLFTQFVTAQAIPAMIIHGIRQEGMEHADWMDSSLQADRLETGSSHASPDTLNYGALVHLKQRLKKGLLMLAAALKGQKFLSVPFE